MRQKVDEGLRQLDAGEGIDREQAKRRLGKRLTTNMGYRHPRRPEIYSEFTVPQTCGPAAMLYATLYALEKEADLFPKDSKPDPLDR